MSRPQMNKKNNPLPSFLSNIRNAVQTKTTSRVGTGFPEDRSQRQQEFRPLIATPDPSAPTGEQEAKVKGFMQRFEIVSRKSYIRGRDRKDVSGKRGFRVQLPTSILVYVTVIFFIVPLLVSLLLLVREFVKYHTKSSPTSSITHDLIEASKVDNAQPYSKDVPSTTILDISNDESLLEEKIQQKGGDKISSSSNLLTTNNETIAVTSNTTSYLRTSNKGTQDDEITTEKSKTEQVDNGNERIR